MEKRHLFKAQRVDNGEWVQGNLVFSVYHKNDVCVGQYGNEVGMHEVDSSTICQCTGLKDKNSKLIWENDIMVAHLDDEYPENETYQRVLWHEGGFYTKENGSKEVNPIDEFDQEYFDVCGNIFDNVELLESEEY